MMAANRAKSSVQIDGMMIDVSDVASGSPLAEGSRHRIEVKISVDVVLHELQECDVQVSYQTLRDFLLQDACNEHGRSGYLTFVQLTHAVSTPSWKWVENSDVQIQDGLVTFHGTAVKCAPNSTQA